MLRSVSMTCMLSCAFVILAQQTTCAQVLQIPKKQPTVDSKPIELEGIVVERKKYSFVVQKDDIRYQVKIPNTVKLTLRLNKPSIDMAGKKVWVEPIHKPGPSGETQTGAKRISFPLPEPLYVRARFDHDRQMKRIMAAAVKRLNKYELSNKIFDSTDDPLVVTGPVKLAADKKTLQLVLGTGEPATIILGHQRARLGGFNITQLVPGSTRVFLKGDVSDGNKVTAAEVDFWPVLVKE